MATTTKSKTAAQMLLQLPSAATPPAAVSFTMGVHRHGWLTLPCASDASVLLAAAPALAALLSHHVAPQLVVPAAGPGGQAPAPAQRPPLALHISLSLLDAAPAERRVSWARGAAARFLAPLLASLSALPSRPLRLAVGARGQAGASDLDGVKLSSDLRSRS